MRVVRGVFRASNSEFRLPVASSKYRVASDLKSETIRLDTRSVPGGTLEPLNSEPWNLVRETLQYNTCAIDRVQVLWVCG